MKLLWLPMGWCSLTEDVVESLTGVVEDTGVLVDTPGSGVVFINDVVEASEEWYNRPDEVATSSDGLVQSPG